MHKHSEITRVGRAKIIDTLFIVAQNLKIDDKSIVYLAISNHDRYYDSKRLNVKARSDCLLKGYTTLFIASKHYEVEPLSLYDFKNHYL